jgi:hypothetical protein
MVRNNKPRFAGLVFSAFVVVMLALPALRWSVVRAADGVLYGYSDDVPAKPRNFVRALIDKSFQRWFEKYFNLNLGFRALLIRTFNARRVGAAIRAGSREAPAGSTLALACATEESFRRSGRCPERS